MVRYILSFYHRMIISYKFFLYKTSTEQVDVVEAVPAFLAYTYALYVPEDSSI